MNLTPLLEIILSTVFVILVVFTATSSFSFTLNAICIFSVCFSWFAGKEAVNVETQESSRSNYYPIKNIHDLLLVGLLFVQRSFDFLVSVVLAKGVYGPDGSGQPTYQGELQAQANDASEWTTNREEGQERKNKRYQESHVFKCVRC
jgi:uncharacterized membrane protein